MKLLQTVTYYIGTLGHSALLLLVGYGIVSQWHFQ